MRNPFLIPHQEYQRLTQVTGRFWGEPLDTHPLLVELLLCFEPTVVTLAVTEEDEIEPVSRISADDPDIYEVDLSGAAPWRGAIGRPLIWAWEMTNQQGYLDGIQLEFAEDVSAESAVIQLIALGAQLRIREISSDFI